MLPRRAPLFLSLFLLSSCGDSPSEPGLVELTPEVRIEVLQAVEGRLLELQQQGLAGEELDQAIGEWFAARPEFEASAVDETGAVWARFTDGRLLIVANNRDPAPPIQTGTIRMGVRGQGLAAAAEATELPSPVQVRLLHSFGPNFEGQGPIDDMRTWFGDAGYTVLSGTEGSAGLEELRDVSGDGFFYLNTHGARGYLRDDQSVFALQSSTLVSKIREDAEWIEEGLAAGRLVYMTARNGERVELFGLCDDSNFFLCYAWDTRYAITHRFVDEHMSFGENSMVFINACWSAHSHDSISEMIFAFHRKKAGVYFGWTRKLSSGAAYEGVRYFVDRLLGANAFSAEDPTQRPFDWVAVLDEMLANGTAIDPVHGGQLVGRPAVEGAGPALLAPSITLVFVDELNEILHIAGAFGQDPGAEGKVVMRSTGGDVALVIESWEPDAIQVAIPRTGPGSSGDVVVSVRGHESNPRRLVAWSGMFKYALDARGSLSEAVEIDLKFRMDPDLIRSAPGEQPQPNPLALSNYHPLAQARYSATGSDSGTQGECEWTDEWEGSGTVQYLGDQTSPFFYEARVDVEARTLKVTLSFWVLQAFTRTRTERCPDGTTTHSESQNAQIAPELFDSGNGATITFPLSETLDIAEGRRDELTSPNLGSDSVPAMLEWQRIPAQPAFDRAQPK